MIKIINILFFFFSITFLIGQGRVYEGPEDPAGDIAAEREGYMTGNRVFLYFRNTTELSDWPKSNVSRWPNNLNGLKMVDGIGLLIGAKVYIKDDPNNLIDSEVITDTTVISAGQNSHDERNGLDVGVQAPIPSLWTIARSPSSV